MTTRAFFIVLALLGAVASASATRSLGDCVDNPNYTHGNKRNNITCQFIKESEHKQQYCKKRKTKKNCEDTCGHCGILRGNCPHKFKSKHFGAEKDSDCDDFETGLKCKYDYSYSIGGNNCDMVCTPSNVLTCSVDDNNNKRWEPPQETTVVQTGVLSTVANSCPNLPFGDRCNTKQCPPMPPQRDALCTWYNGIGDCEYNYRTTGCTEEERQCSAMSSFSCDQNTHTWNEMVADPAPCGDSDQPLPFYQECDPTECPVRKPNANDSCVYEKGAENDQCFYGYKVHGCTEDTLQCKPTTLVSCGKNNKWDEVPLVLEACTVPDSPIVGTECDPTECPPMPPQWDASCALYDGIGDCEYNYRTTGCTEEERQCSAMSFFSCDQNTQMWNEMVAEPAPCDDPDEPIFEECDPTECPVRKPNANDACVYEQGAENEKCSYEYKVHGCTEDTLQCIATLSFTCGRDNRWDEEPILLPACVVTDSPVTDLPIKGNECDPKSCPIVAPEDKSDCSGYSGGDETCDYDYKTFGCIEETAGCLAKQSFQCVENQWDSIAVIRPMCAPTQVRGGSKPLWYDVPCDPEVYKPPKPVDGEVECPEKEPVWNGGCSGSPEGGCGYGHYVAGCITLEATCTPINTFFCESGKWHQQSNSAELCEYTQGEAPFGALCDPSTFDPSIYGKPSFVVEECPEEDPGWPTGGPCSGLPEGGCGYSYVVAGCPIDQLSCMPINTFVCQSGYLHEIYNSMEQCEDTSGVVPYGEKCDPSTFDPSIYDTSDGDIEFECPVQTRPELQTSCDPSDQCYYDYRVTGCTRSELRCSPSLHYYCDEDERGWTAISDAIPACTNPSQKYWPQSEPCDPDTFDVNDYDIDETSEEGVCPQEEPTFPNCTKTGLKPDKECTYNHVVMGCDEKPLRCEPLARVTCSTEQVFAVQVQSMEECKKPRAGYGEKCDPSTFGKEQMPV